ncbi:MAG: hypothetical protein HY074_06985 [Deltaproteobacteria bacterium]|nr:hypothetical protein [Deltaproteobacteria bacterium]
MSLSLALAIMMCPGFARAAAPVDYSNPDQVEPYIESLKKKYDIKPRPLTEAPRPAEAKTPAAENIENKAPLTDPNEVQPYIENLRRKNGLAPEAPLRGSSNPGAVQPYIESIKKDPELEPKFKNTVNTAAGFSFVASNQFKITSNKDIQANTFESVYSPDSKYAPSADVFVERQLYRNRYVGALGVVGHLNVISIAGKGVFTKTGATSPDTTFRFLAIPVSVGVSYRFLQMRFIDPFISLSAVAIPFLETRNDDHPSRRAMSRGYNVTGGLAFNLDWITRKDAWEQYDNNGVLHTYLLAQLEVLRTLSGAVNFAYNATYIGLMFEF